MKEAPAFPSPEKLAVFSSSIMDPERISALKRLIRYLNEQGIFIKGGDSILERDVSHIMADRVLILDAARQSIAALRHMQDALPTNHVGEYTRLLPDEVHEDYVLIFRSVCRSEEELSAVLEPYHRAMRRVNNGFSNVSIFPDGKGSAVVDTFGMPGVWISQDVPPDMPTRRVIRVIDSISTAIGDSLYPDEMIAIKFTDYPQSGADVFLSDDNRICLTRDFANRTRDKQVEILNRLLEGRKEILVRKIDRSTTPAVYSRGQKSAGTPNVIVTQLALVEELRSKDYHHYKCSQKTESIAKSLQAQGFGVVYIPIEDDISYSEFLSCYRQDRQDVVLISMYQVKSNELALYHRLVGDIRVIHSQAFIVVEGASTNMAKQFLALSPEIDMFIRGESDVAISFLVGIKVKGLPLAEEDLHRLRPHVEGGFVVRSGKYVLVSNLDRTNVNKNIHLLDPERYWYALWYAERGCPCECFFCRRDTGGNPRHRSVSADERITWMLKRLLLEVDTTCGVDIDRLREILRTQAHDPNATLLSHPDVRLLSDTFLGKQKITILVVSENALATRAVMMAFALKARDLGLRKYFDLKIADTGIATFLRHGKPDLEFMHALRDAGVSFIGFGTENLSDTILSEMRKGYPRPYALDDIIAINNALVEAGFSPTNIRNNLIFSTPYSQLNDVKDAILLTYIAPVFNSAPEYFGHGWGNNRFNRTFDVAASTFTAMDHLQYSWIYRFENMEDRGGYRVSDYFFVAKDTPEYLMRQGFRYLKYIDERIPVLTAKFGFPTFYRYAQKDFLRNHFTDEDVSRAVDTFCRSVRCPAKLDLTTPSAEKRSLGELMTYYMGQWPSRSPLEVLFILKAHMISRHAYSFVSYMDLLRARPELPMLFEAFRVSELVDIADALMIPGEFDPAGSMRYLREAVLTAAIVEEFGGSDVSVEAVCRICLDTELCITDKISQVSVLACFASASEKVRAILEADEAWKTRNEQEGYLPRMAYPDRQAFDFIRCLFIYAPDELLFSMVVSRMNVKRLPFPQAVKELVCERFSIPLAEYPSFVKAFKEYSKHRIYYCRGGLFERLRSKEQRYVSEAVEDMLFQLEKENNKYIIRNVAIALKELAQGERLLEIGVFISSPSVISKVSASLDIGAEKVLKLGPRLVILDWSLHNREKAQRLQEKLPDAVFTEEQIRLLDRGDWVSVRFREGQVLPSGTWRHEKEFLGRYVDKMKFRGNSSLFSSYLSRFSAISGRHKLQIMVEIAEFFGVMAGDRPYLRAMMLPAEEYLYILPLVKLVNENEDLVPIFIARGMEPLYMAYRYLMKSLFPNARLDDREIYTKITKKANRDLPDYILKSPKCDDSVHSVPPEICAVYLSINSLLTVQESKQAVTRSTWKAVAERAAALGLREPLDSFLVRIWKLTHGLDDMMSRGLTLSEAVKYIAGFGLDEEHIKYTRTVRRAFFTLPLMSFEFSNNPGGYPVEKLAEEIRAKNAKLEYPLSDEALKNAVEGLGFMGGQEQRLLHEQRNTINNYIMTLGNSTTAGMLRRKGIQHSARPLLNILLKGTRVHSILENRGDRRKTALYVDETSSTATTALLCELVMKAFHGNINFEGFNVSSRTSDTQKVLRESGLIRHAATSGIWILEDMHEIYRGVYEDDTRDGKSYVLFSDLRERLLEKAAEEKKMSGMNDLEISARIAEINRRADCIVDENGHRFEVVDGVKTRKYDAKTVKRQIVKNIMRSEDWVQQSIAEDDYFVCLSISEFDFIGRYFIIHFREELIADGFDTQLQELRALDKEVRYADQVREMERFARNAENMEAERAAASNDFMMQMGGPVRAYLDGKIDFEEVEKVFYEIYALPMPRF